MVNCSNDSEVYSFHAGGATVVFADRHVQFLRQDVNAQVALITRAAEDVPRGEY